MKRLVQSALLLFALAALCRPARAQVTVGENTEMNLSGDVTFGYSGVFAEEGINQTLFGANFDLTGFFYDPKFFNFRLSPYYNESRVNANYYSMFAGKGFTASGNLFAGSNHPVSFTYERDWNSEGNFSVPGAPGYTTHGNSAGFSIGGGLYFNNWPTLQVSFSKSNSAYDLIGSDLNGTSDLKAFNVTSTYSRWGFNMTGTYSKANIMQEVPTVFAPFINLDQTSNQQTLQFTASRQLWRTARWTGSVSHTDYAGGYAAATNEQSFNNYFNNFNWQATSKLMIDANVDYTSNAGAYLLTLLPPGPGLPPVLLPEFRDSSYFTTGARVTYTLSDSITVQGGVGHVRQNYLGVELSTTDANGAVSYQHALWGGQFTAHYGMSYFTAPSSVTDSLGQMAGFGFSHDFVGWKTSIGAQYATNQVTALLGYVQSSYSANLSTSRYFGSWLLMLSGMVGKNSMSGYAGSDGLNTSYSAALSHRRFSVNASVSHSSGESLPTLGGLQPVPIPIPGLLITYTGNSYAAGVGYQPVRRLQLTGTYTRSHYETGQFLFSSNNMFERIDARAEYSFRQMHINGGFTHLTQGVGATSLQPQTINSVYFGISRHFDFF